MKIVRYSYTDVYFNDDESEAAEIFKKKMEKQGWSLESRDAGSKDYANCDQYLRYGKSQIITTQELAQ